MWHVKRDPNTHVKRPAKETYLCMYCDKHMTPAHSANVLTANPDCAPQQICQKRPKYKRKETCTTDPKTMGWPQIPTAKKTSRKRPKYKHVHICRSRLHILHKRLIYKHRQTSTRHTYTKESGLACTYVHICTSLLHTLQKRLIYKHKGTYTRETHMKESGLALTYVYICRSLLDILQKRPAHKCKETHQQTCAGVRRVDLLLHVLVCVYLCVSLHMYAGLFCKTCKRDLWVQ